METKILSAQEAYKLGTSNSPKSSDQKWSELLLFIVYQ